MPAQAGELLGGEEVRSDPVEALLLAEVLGDGVKGLGGAIAGPVGDGVSGLFKPKKPGKHAAGGPRAVDSSCAGWPVPSNVGQSGGTSILDGGSRNCSPCRRRQ